jgi:Carboxypeptidase regulatory-like domain
MKLIVSIILVLSYLMSKAQTGVLEGRILTKMGSTVVEDAVVMILKNDNVIHSSKTNENGEFKILNVPQGKYKVIIRLYDRETLLTEQTEITNNKTTKLNAAFPKQCEGIEMKCTRGHTDLLIPIQYGLPSTELIMEADMGKVRLGGCLVTHCDPKWYCKKHKIEL